MLQFAKGKANAFEERAKQIEKAVHELGKELLSVSLSITRLGLTGFKNVGLLVK